MFSFSRAHGRYSASRLLRATLDRRIRLGEKTPVAREFVGNAQVEAKLRACAQASSHGLSLQHMNLTADRGQSASWSTR